MEQNNVGVLAIARRFPQAIAEIRRTIMNTIDKILRAEHQELLPHVDELRLLADSLDEIDSADVRPRLEHVHEFLAEHLIPHAAMEEEALYPAVARILGSPLSTATMSLDHVEVRRLTEQLNLLRSEQWPFQTEHIKTLRRLLYGLHTLLKVHFAKEEEIYLPLLESHLSNSEAQGLLHRMTQAARTASTISGES
jgi:hemerythrin-like domain-containing protein